MHTLLNPETLSPKPDTLSPNLGTQVPSYDCLVFRLGLDEFVHDRIKAHPQVTLLISRA